jgi:hypothetical protein
MGIPTVPTLVDVATLAVTASGPELKYKAPATIAAMIITIIAIAFPFVIAVRDELI